MPPPPNLTPAQLAKAAERRAAKEAKRAAQAAGLVEMSEDQKREKERARFLVRGWTGTWHGRDAGQVGKEWGNGDEGGGGVGERSWKGVRVVSWNVSYCSPSMTTEEEYKLIR